MRLNLSLWWEAGGRAWNGFSRAAQEDWWAASGLSACQDWSGHCAQAGGGLRAAWGENEPPILYSDKSKRCKAKERRWRKQHYIQNWPVYSDSRQMHPGSDEQSASIDIDKKQDQAFQLASFLPFNQCLFSQCIWQCSNCDCWILGLSALLKSTEMSEQDCGCCHL